MQGGRAASWSRGVRLAGWWLPLFALWLLLVGQWSWLVGIWGAGMSLVAAVSAGAVVSQGLLDVRGRWGWCREAGPAAAAVVADFVIVTAVLVRAIGSRRRRVGVFRQDASASGTGPLAAGRRAWVELVAGWSPNCYVIDISAESGRRLVHDLRPHRPSERPS